MNLVAWGVCDRTTPGWHVGSLMPSVPKMVKASPPKKCSFPQLYPNCKVLLQLSACWAAKLCSGALLNFRGEQMSNIFGIPSTKLPLWRFLKAMASFQVFCSQAPSFHSKQKEYFCEVSVPLKQICFLIHTCIVLALPDSHPTKPVVYGAAPVRDDTLLPKHRGAGL